MNQEQLRNLRRWANKARSVNRKCVECGAKKPEPLFSEFCAECRKSLLK